jgi:hypothetical protein
MAGMGIFASMGFLRRFLAIAAFVVPALLASGRLYAQDSTLLQDTPRRAQPATAVPDSMRPVATDSTSPLRQAVSAPDTSLAFFNQLNPFIDTGGKLFYRMESSFEPPNKDFLFYWLAGGVLVLGIIRIAFSKYFSDMLRIFSQTTFRQKAIRDQLVQNRLASLLMNLFFCFSAGTFLYQLGEYRHWFGAGTVWWQQSLLCMAFVAAVYAVKYLSIHLSGWLFGLRELADTYTFMVFLVNKVVGIMLLPASIALALGVADLKAMMVVASLFGLGFLFLYRYVLAVPLLRQHVRVIPFHFFIYFCAFEIVPVLVIYKWMLSIIGQ